MEKRMISKYVSYDEATYSGTAKRLGIKNEPNAKEIEAMEYVAKNVFDKVREHFGVPLRVNSFFRSKELNKAVGGSSQSQHSSGMAIDIDVFDGSKVTTKQIFDFIRKNCDYDQLIWEHGSTILPDWVHLSLKKEGNRKDTRRAIRQTVTLENGKQMQKTLYPIFDLYK